MHLAYIDTFFHILKIGLEIRLKAGKPPVMWPTFSVFVSTVRFKDSLFARGLTCSKVASTSLPGQGALNMKITRAHKMTIPRRSKIILKLYLSVSMLSCYIDIDELEN